MSHRAAFQSDRSGFWDVIVAPLLRQVWAVALIATFGILAVVAMSGLQVPRYEATAVLQAGARWRCTR